MIVNLKTLGVWCVASSTGKVVTIIPGVNEIPDNDWNSISKHPTVKARIDEGVLVLIKTAIPADKKSKNASDKDTSDGLPGILDGMNAAAAVDFIGGVFDTEQLKSWKKKETRSSVITAIDKQIKAVKAVEDSNKE